MQSVIIWLMRWVVMIFLVVQVYQLVSVLMGRNNKFTQLAKNVVDSAIGRTKTYYFSRENLTAMMSRYGLMHMIGDYNMEPSSFLILKGGCGIILMILGISLMDGALLKIAVGTVLLILGFFIPDIFIKISNQSDNTAMQDDIITIYNILRLHAKAGVFITDSLIECQREVGNKRLKEALMELNNNVISGKLTTEEAVDLFNARFSFDQIDNLSVIIKQSLRTGRAVEILSDISKQIEDTNRNRAQDEKDKTKRKTAGIQAFFFIMITVLAIYLVGMQMAVSLSSI